MAEYEAKAEQKLSATVAECCKVTADGALSLVIAIVQTGLLQGPRGTLRFSSHIQLIGINQYNYAKKRKQKAPRFKISCAKVPQTKMSQTNKKEQVPLRTPKAKQKESEQFYRHSLPLTSADVTFANTGPRRKACRQNSLKPVCCKHM